MIFNIVTFYSVTLESCSDAMNENFYINSRSVCAYFRTSPRRRRFTCLGGGRARGPRAAGADAGVAGRRTVEGLAFGAGSVCRARSLLRSLWTTGSSLEWGTPAMQHTTSVARLQIPDVLSRHVRRIAELTKYVTSVFLANLVSLALIISDMLTV